MARREKGELISELNVITQASEQAPSEQRVAAKQSAAAKGEGVKRSWGSHGWRLSYMNSRFKVSSALEASKILSSTARQIIFWVLIIAGALLIYKLVNPGSKNIQDLSITQLTDKIKTGEIAKMTIKATEVDAIGTDNKEYRTSLSNEKYKADLMTFAAEKKEGTSSPKAEVQEESSGGYWWPALYYLLPFLLIFGFWIFMLRQMQSGGNKALSFGKSRAKLLSNQQKRVTFKDVAGVEEAKEELQEIIEFLKEPQKFQKLGGRIPKGVLMMGPPGTGKTLLARAIAGEANVPFFAISAFEFVVMFVGVGASRVRDLFEQGKKNAPYIIVI